MSNYRKTMADALREMYPLTEETQLDEATMSSSQIARLKKAYEPMRDKKISVSNADKLSAMMDKVGKDKEALIQLFKADIPFVSQSAVTKLITKHNMKGAEINKLREEVEIDEAIPKSTMYALVIDGKVVAKGSKSDMMRKKKKEGGTVYNTPGSKIGDKIKEEVELDEGKMSQLHQYIKDKKSAEQIAKLMKLDVKTIKALMSEVEPDDEEEEIKEGAASDARRAMMRDKDLRRGKDSADRDNSATDDDVKAASKNIMMQLRKSISLKGKFDVEFGDKKKVKIPAKMAHAVTQKYNSLKKPADKEKFQAKVAKSYKHMLRTMKEGFEPSETILERMNRKLRENKNG